MDDKIQKKLEESIHGRRAEQYFVEGYNCTQSVVLSFMDEINMDKQQILRLASPLGGGMGRLREVCGTVSGMFLVLGILYGYDDPKDYEGKKLLYQRVQELADRFRKINGSIVCKELLGLKKKESDYVPEKRTEEYYKKRPCGQLCGVAAMILEEYLEELKEA